VQVDHYAKRMQYKSLQPRDLSAEETNPYDWDPKQQLSLLRAANALGYTHPGLLEAITSSMMPTSWAASPDTLAYLLHELARAGVASSTLAAQLAENRINPQLAALSLREMAAALSGCAQMGARRRPSRMCPSLHAPRASCLLRRPACHRQGACCENSASRRRALLQPGTLLQGRWLSIRPATGAALPTLPSLRAAK
jgi:hypothetical protein